MRLAALGEVGLLRRLARRLPRHPSVLVGIGDDAAILRAPRGGLLVFASDMLVEGVHFKRSGPGRVAPPWIGWKALASNVSDVAAMGGCPRWAVVSLGMPRNTSVQFADQLYEGLARCAKRYGVTLVGGDTVRAPRVVIDVAILGTVRPADLVLRSRARVGDAVFTTGRLGGSYISGRHARFAPRVAEAQQLVRQFRIHAMMDISDGLVADAWQISRASKVTLRLEERAIPTTQAARRCPRRRCPCRRQDSPGAYHALMDGEDFELLFVVGPQDAARMPKRVGRCLVTRIGSVVARGAGVQLRAVDDRIEALIPEGFRHF